jgi:hypothetical protein
MAGTGVGKFSSTAGNNTSNMTTNFAENMAPSNVNNAARELMGHIYDMYKQLGDGYFEYGDGDATYTVARSDADTITITSSSDISSIYFPGRKIRITDGGANVVEGTIASSSHSSTTQTVNLTGISLASGTPTKVELGIDTAAFGGRLILDDDGDTYIEAVTDDTIDFYAGGTKIGTFTTTTVDFNDGVTITTADNSDTLTLKSTDDDTAEGPVLKFTRDPSGVADGDLLGTIKFVGDDAGGNATDYFELQSSIGDEGAGSEDGRLTFYGMVGGTARNVLDITHSNIVFNQDSQNIDFRVESDGVGHMLFVNAGANRVGIATSDPIRTFSVGNDGIIGLEGSSNSITFTESSSLKAYIASQSFGDHNGDGLGIVTSGDEPVKFHLNGTETFRIDTTHSGPHSGKFSTFGETAPDCSDGGITAQQGSNDSSIISLKSTDIAHGGTGTLETDTYAQFTKVNGASGGLAVLGYSDDSSAYGLFLGGRSSGVNTAVSTSAIGCVHIQAQSRSGATGYAGMGSTKNVCVMADAANARFTFNASGQFFADADIGADAFDEYEDAQLVRAYDLSHGRGVIDSKFDDYIKYNHESLAEAGLVGREEDGTPNHFVNVTGFQRLHNGAIWQQYEKHQRLASAFYKLAEKTIGKEEADKLLTDEEIQLLN